MATHSNQKVIRGYPAKNINIGPSNQFFSKTNDKSKILYKKKSSCDDLRTFLVFQKLRENFEHKENQWRYNLTLRRQKWKRQHKL
jgi:hypothetical protein